MQRSLKNNENAAFSNFKKQYQFKRKSVFSNLKFSTSKPFSNYVWNAKPIESALTPNPSWYHDSDFYQKYEKPKVFSNHWICVGHEAQLLKENSYLSGSVANNPFLVIRKENKLSAFYNVCRHHASTLLFDQFGEIGNSQIVCPYHGWTYSTDGKLKKATRLKGIQDFSAKDFGLLPIELEKCGPFIFLNFNDDKTSSQDWNSFLSGTLQVLSQLEEKNIKNLNFVSRLNRVVNCNWKVFVENYLDGGYHVPILHSDLSGQLDEKSYTTEIFPLSSMQSVKGGSSTNLNNTKVLNNPLSDGTGLDFSDRIGDLALYAYIYPNMMINRYGPWLDINYALPISPTQCSIIMDYFIEPNFLENYSEPKNFIEKSLNASERVQVEDERICEAVQRGVNSISYEKLKGRYAPKVEQALYHFHELHSKTLGLYQEEK